MDKPTHEEYTYREIKYKTFPLYYALKYKFLNEASTHNELIEKIYNYEMNNVNELLRNGVDKITGEYGYFLQ